MSRTDGYISLTAKLDTAQLKKDITETERDLKRYAKEKEKLINEKKQVVEGSSELKQRIKDYEALIEKNKEYARERERLAKIIDTGKYSEKEWGAYKTAGEKMRTSGNELALGRAGYEQDLEQYKQVEAKLNDIGSKLKDNKRLTNEATTKLADQRQDLNNMITEQEELNKRKKRQKEIEEQNKKFQQEVDKGFKKMFKSAKMFIGGLIGVRAAYGLIRRAASAYVASNEKLTKQTEANWLGLGTALAPIIDYIYKLIRKLVTGILYLLKQITGVDLIAKANAAILKKNAEATKKLTKENDKLAASFDELEVLQDNSKDQEKIETMPLFNENDLSEGTRKKLEQLAEPIKKIVDGIKAIIQFGIDHPELVATVLGGAALWSFLKKILGVGGTNGSGLLGIHGILSAIKTIGVITIVINVSKIVKTLEETREATDAVDDYIDARRKQAKEAADADKKIIQSGKMTAEQQKKITKTNTDGIAVMEKRNETVLDTLNGYSKLQLTTKNMTGELQNNVNTLQSNLYTQYQELQVLEELYRAGKLNKEETEDYKNKLAAFNEILNGSSEQAKDTRKWFNYFGDSTQKLAELQAYASNTAREFDANLKGVGGTTQIANDGVNALKDALGLIPKNNVIKVDGSKVKTAKSDAMNLINNLEALTKKTFKVKTEVQITSVATSQVLSMADLGANVIKKIYGLASGGIVNNPGQGVPISRNIVAGEAGPEAVLPLDETTMTWLAKLIANNMSVNLTNINQMNGRQISKEIKRISANEDYAFNI